MFDALFSFLLPLNSQGSALCTMYMSYTYTGLECSTHAAFGSHRVWINYRRFRTHVIIQRRDFRAAPLQAEVLLVDLKGHATSDSFACVLNGLRLLGLPNYEINKKRSSVNINIDVLLLVGRNGRSTKSLSLFYSTASYDRVKRNRHCIRCH